MKSSCWKQGAGSSLGHMLTLHQRLYHALNLRSRHRNDKGHKWHYPDIEIQRLVVRSVDAFLDSMSAESLQHQLVKESVGDIVGAVGSILASKSEATMKLASDVAVKIIHVIPSSMLQPHFSNLIHPLSSLLSFQQLRVAISCASALNLTLLNLNSKREQEVWDILKTTNVVGNLVENIKGYSTENKATEYFQEMASLLSKILWRWPPSRFHVWTDTTLLNILDTVKLNPDCSIRIAVMQLFSALALCGNAANKLLDDGEDLVKIIVESLDSSNSYSIQIEGLRLAQCLMTSEQGCSKIIKLSCEPIVKAIITLMSNWSLDAGKLARFQMSILVEACRLALITRWEGDHHFYFWKAGVDGVLLRLIVGNSDITQQSLHSLSLQEQIIKLEEVFDADVLLPLRPYVWDILGCLAAHCMEDFFPKMHGNETVFNVLVVCAWDIILEAETSRPSTPDCNSCSTSVLHLHVHKAILWPSCEYLRALFQSGMQESHSMTIKVPVCWDSLVKLVSWFYSGELPRPISGCLWDNLSEEEKLHELEPYVELCWLGQFWLLEDLHDKCFSLIVSILDSYRCLSIKIIQMAANLNQWKLVEVAAEYLAPIYHHLRNSNEFDALDEHLIEIIRAASVQFSQRNGHLLSLT